MEAKLAEFRKRKLQQQQSTKSTRQKLADVFTWNKSDAEAKQESGGQDVGPSSPTDTPPDTTRTQERGDNDQDEDTEDVPTQPWGKYDWMLLALKMSLWLVVWKIFIELQFGAVFFVVSALVFVYVNTRSGKRSKRTLSAYSVFNPNCERLQGTITAEQFEAELLHRKPPQ